MKKVKMIQIQGLEPECPKCKGSNAMLNAHQDKLRCRDCGFLVEEKEIEVELITMQEGQERLRKYGGLFIFEETRKRREPEKTMIDIDKVIKLRNLVLTAIEITEEDKKKFESDDEAHPALQYQLGMLHCQKDIRDKLNDLIIQG